MYSNDNHSHNMSSVQVRFAFIEVVSPWVLFLGNPYQ